jgi:DNA primase
VLFALDKAKKAILKEKAVILCEGQIDAISCHEQGVENAIAPLGTAFTSQHARILKRYAQTAVLCFDADLAGMKACERAFRELAPEGLSVKVVELPAGDDPDTFLKAHGVEGFRKEVAKARDFFDFKIESGRKSGRLETAEGRTEMTRECTELLALMGDHAARDQQINVVASMLGVGSSTLRQNIGLAAKKAKAMAERTTTRDNPNQSQEEFIEAMPLDRTVGYLCNLAITSAPAQHYLNEQFETLHMAKAWVEGINLLEKILSVSPDPESNAAVNAFISSLRKSEQLALHQVMGGVELKSNEGLGAAEYAVGMLSSIVLQKRDAAVKAALKEPGISTERMISLLEEAKEIAKVLKDSERSLYDDELPQETKKPEKKPWEKWKK